MMYELENKEQIKKNYFTLRMIGISLVIISLWLGNIPEHVFSVRLFFIAIQVVYLLLICSNIIVEGKPTELSKEVYLLTLSIIISLLTILPVLYSAIIVLLTLVVTKTISKINSRANK